MYFIKPTAEFDLISFGEVMLRQFHNVRFLKNSAAVQNLMLHQVRQTLACVLPL